MANALADGWECFEGQDALADEECGRALPAYTEAELSECQAICLTLGYGGFSVRRGIATMRPFSRQELLDARIQTYRERSTVLYVAPAPKEHTGEGLVTISYESIARRISPERLIENSGYFASVFRHDWADGQQESYNFAEFPGGEEAFSFAVTWLSAGPTGPYTTPWPVKQYDTLCAVFSAAAYLDASALVASAAQSWRWCVPSDIGHSFAELLRVAHALARSSSQFTEDEQGPILLELRATLQDVPKHKLALSTEFLEAPSAGLAVLDLKSTAAETLVGQIKNIGGWVGNLLGKRVGLDPLASDATSTDTSMSAHDFAVRLFDAHELFFLEHLPQLRRVLAYVDPSLPVASGVCFRLASAAIVATTMTDGEVFAGMRLAEDIFEHCFEAAHDPVELAADVACVGGLFGAGNRHARLTNGSVLSLDILLRPRVPPVAAAVILSRVLSSWGASECDDGNTCKVDAADVILAGVKRDRQGLRTMLDALLPLITVENGGSCNAHWGSVYDYAVPELRAAFVRAAEHASTSGVIAGDAILKLLFRIVYQPSGGLLEVSFPLGLLAELQSHNTACVLLVARRVIRELRTSGDKGEMANAWALAETLWPFVTWDSVDAELLEEVVCIFRQWLYKAKDDKDSKRDVKTRTVRLLQQLPLQRLADIEHSLAPPIPAHVLASVAWKESQSSVFRVAALEAENAELKEQISRFKSEARN